MTATKYAAKFTTGMATRTSSHTYATAAVAIKDGKTYGTPVFSKNVARASMPGDHFRASARCGIYNQKQKARLIEQGEMADAGWTVEVVSVEVVK